MRTGRGSGIRHFIYVHQIALCEILDGVRLQTGNKRFWSDSDIPGFTRAKSRGCSDKNTQINEPRNPALEAIPLYVSKRYRSALT